MLFLQFLHVSYDFRPQALEKGYVSGCSGTAASLSWATMPTGELASLRTGNITLDARFRSFGCVIVPPPVAIHAPGLPHLKPFPLLGMPTPLLEATPLPSTLSGASTWPTPWRSAQYSESARHRRRSAQSGQKRFLAK